MEKNILEEANKAYINEEDIEKAENLYKKALGFEKYQLEAAYQLLIMYFDYEGEYSSLKYVKLIEDGYNLDYQYDIGKEIIEYSKNHNIDISIIESGITCLLKSKKCSTKYINIVLNKYYNIANTMGDKKQVADNLVKWYKSIYGKNEVKKLIKKSLVSSIREIIEKSYNAISSINDYDDVINYLSRYSFLVEIIHMIDDFENRKCIFMISHMENVDDENSIKDEIKKISDKNKIQSLLAKLYEKIALFYKDTDIDLALKYYELADDNSNQPISRKDIYLESLCENCLKKDNYELAYQYANMLSKKDRVLEKINKRKRRYNARKKAELEYELNHKFYATNNYRYVKVTKNVSIDLKANNIYYLTEYYRSKCQEDYKDNKKICEIVTKNFRSFISLKDGYYDSDNSYINFDLLFSNFLKLLNENWIVCTVPGHRMTNNDNNNMSNFINPRIKNNEKLELKNNLIKRVKETEAKHLSNNRSCDYENDMSTLELNRRIDVLNKNVLIIDDITTSGASLIACRNLVLDGGANYCIIMAFGKTEAKYVYE